MRSKIQLTHGIRKVFFAFISISGRTLIFEKSFLDSSNKTIPTSTSPRLTLLEFENESLLSFKNVVSFMSFFHFEDPV